MTGEDYHTQRELAALSRRLLSLSEWAQQLSPELSEEELGRAAIHALRRVLAFDTATIYILQGPQRLHLLSSTSPALDQREIAGQQAWDSYPGQIVRNLAPVLIHDALEDVYPPALSDCETKPVRSLIGTPIILAGRCLGVIEVTSREPAAFGSTDLELLSAFANLLAFTIQNHNLVKAQRRRADRQQLLLNIAHATTRLESLSNLLPRAAALIREAMDYRFVEIFIANREHNEPKLVALSSTAPLTPLAEGYRQAIDQGMVDWVIQHGQIKIINDVTRETEFVPAGDVLIASMVAVPLKSGDQALGALAAGSERKQAFDPLSVADLEILADQLSIAIQNAQLFDDIERQSRRLVDQIERAHDVIINLDTQGRFTLFNAAAERLLGYPREQILGQPFSTLLRTGRLYPRRGTHEVQLGCADGSTVTLEITSTPLLEGDKQVGMQLIGRDISERRRLERLRAEFVATVSHELRTPLASIRGCIETLLTGKPGPLTEVQCEFLGLALDSSQRLSELITDLLDTAQVEAGSLKLKLSTPSLDELVIPLVDAIRPTAEAKGLSISFFCEPGPYKLEGDPQRLEEVVNNLLSNAVKFTPTGGRIAVRLSHAAESGSNYLIFEVEDTGIGIPPQDIPHIFERFHRAENVLGQAIEGTGIGLYLSRAIVRQHGGEIRVTSELGRGTCFTVRLPALREELMPD
jgi:PAS domain S-box-containing protein